MLISVLIIIIIIMIIKLILILIMMPGSLMAFIQNNYKGIDINDTGTSIMMLIILLVRRTAFISNNDK